MDNLLYTHEEAVKLIRQSITNIPMQSKNISKKSSYKQIIVEPLTIRNFAKIHKLNYSTIINCLNSKDETRPGIVVQLLKIILNTQEVNEQTRHFYQVKTKKTKTVK